MPRSGKPLNKTIENRITNILNKFAVTTEARKSFDLKKSHEQLFSKFVGFAMQFINFSSWG